LVWVAYKILRLALELKSCPTRNVIQAFKKAQVHSLSDQIMNQVSSISPSRSAQNLWIIHGVSFDMTDFVYRHPGGVEAIELGRGRDCTALFESYHPFTDRHWKILDKYRTLDTNIQKLRKVSTDPFYEVLKERAFDALNRNGVDPITQRCATYGRAAYYFAISVSVLISAFYHVKVSSGRTHLSLCHILKSSAKTSICVFSAGIHSWIFGFCCLWMVSRCFRP